MVLIFNKHQKNVLKGKMFFPQSLILYKNSRDFSNESVNFTNIRLDNIFDISRVNFVIYFLYVKGFNTLKKEVLPPNRV